jgi:ferredoxin
MNMSENIKTKVAELLSSGQIKGFLGLRSNEGHIGPYLFTNEAELDSLVVGDFKRPGDSRYPLNKFLINIACKYPEDTFGVLARGCDERGLKALYTWNQLNPNKVKVVGIACPQDLADACECLKPYPDECLDSQKANPCEQKSVSAIDALTVSERFSVWIKEFTKCVKCYGCRDVCPMCFCNECSVGSDDLIHTGQLPPEMPIFHLTRAVHMIGRCIDCGLCNEACPADIPLRTLYKKVADIIDKEFQYRPGYSDQKSPLNVL